MVVVLKYFQSSLMSNPASLLVESDEQRRDPSFWIKAAEIAHSCGDGVVTVSPADGSTPPVELSNRHCLIQAIAACEDLSMKAKQQLLRPQPRFTAKHRLKSEPSMSSAEGLHRCFELGHNDVEVCSALANCEELSNDMRMKATVRWVELCPRDYKGWYSLSVVVGKTKDRVTIKPELEYMPARRFASDDCIIRFIRERSRVDRLNLSHSLAEGVIHSAFRRPGVLPPVTLRAGPRRPLFGGSSEIIPCIDLQSHDRLDPDEVYIYDDCSDNISHNALRHWIP